MGMVEVTVNGRRHQLQCDDGQELRLRRLATYVDNSLSRLLQQHGQIPDSKAMVLTSILIADELADALDELKRTRSQLTDATRKAEEEAAGAMQQVAERLERLAAALDRA